MSKCHYSLVDGTCCQLEEGHKGSHKGLHETNPLIGKLLKDHLRERDDLQVNFDLRWKADMRAIKMWQKAHPGNDLVWPDHADLCVWLLEERERLLKLMEKVLAHLPQNTVSVTLWDEDDGTIVYHPWYLEATAVIDAARGQKEAKA